VSAHPDDPGDKFRVSIADWKRREDETS